ncbi:uncharacterized protein K460DRAFT_201953 [Cucurbitaria berberidis CBS 394.84]|uniref:Uncharacterized protein n=1 Tax=Cucurbitaria berberidis CBS 394.84 TaxID=1168544 RepID=A0A9P4G9Q6_9PLEO|nr:uncharacterized protein K460DRAFT_201953 [Cucurbitaria berberidis CBS 394.84]KAF1841285.1 hypothetical protein K460DRAFT_201953 [Cucurbitaria berberidis CBS 394.84]
MPEIDLGPNQANCTSRYAYTNPLCPAGGYQALIHKIYSGQFWSNICDAKNSLYTPEDFLSLGTTTLVGNPAFNFQMKDYILFSIGMGHEALHSAAIAIHGPAAWVGETLGNDWYNASFNAKYDLRTQSMRYKYFATSKSFVDAPVPAVRVVCGIPTPLDRLQTTVSFPVTLDHEHASELFENGGPLPRAMERMNIQDDSMHLRSYTEFVRVFRVRLANSTWTNATMGLLVEFPWSNSTSRNVSGCVLDPRWVEGGIVYEKGMTPQPSLRHSSVNKTSIYGRLDLFKPTPTWTRIDMTEALFDAINFPLPNTLAAPIFGLPTMIQPTNATSLEALVIAHLSRDGLPKWPAEVMSHSLAMLFADALARVGSWRTPPQSPHPDRRSDWAAQLLKGDHGGNAYTDPPIDSRGTVTYFKMKQIITGYAYKASEKTDYLALAVVFAIYPLPFFTPSSY